MSLVLLDDLKPADLGLDQFDEFRKVQIEAIEMVSLNERRFTGLCVPTGGGKTGIAAGIHRLTGWRTAILTATKGLQSVYEREFQNIGIVDARGKQNFECRVYEGTCADGARIGCEDGFCGYGEMKGRLRRADVSVSNYAFWLYFQENGGSFSKLTKEVRDELDENPIECLILDEAHEAEKFLADFMGVRLYEKELIEMIGVEDAAEMKEDMKAWTAAARDWFYEIDIQLENMNRILKMKGHGTRAELQHAARLEGLLKKMERIKEIDPQDDEWVLEAHQSSRWGNSWSFDVVRPGRFAESKLFRGVPHVVAMSATLREKTLDDLWIRKEEREFREWRRIFPAQKGPVYHLPPMKEVDGERKMININRNTSEKDLKIWMDLNDRFMEEWLDFKGIVQSVSYARQQYFMEHSKWSKYMIGNTSEPDSDSALQVFEKFIKMKPPAILVSPSFGTGWDFIGDRARWGLLPKVPFPPMVGKVMKARLKRDKSYGDHIAIQALMQMIGRLVRDFDDWGIGAITDGSLSFLMMRSGGLAPQWFKQGIRRVNDVPKRKDGL